MNLLMSFAICLAIDFGLQFLLASLAVPQYVIDLVIAFILALVFSLISYWKSPDGILKNPKFHKHFAYLFLLLLAVTLVIGYLL